MFSRLDTTYSLVSVVAEQLRMLLDAGLTVRLLVCEQFDETSRFGVYLDDRIEWARVTNSKNGKQFEWRDYDQPYADVPASFFEEAQLISDNLVSLLADMDVCILHDILYQGWYLLQNVALRKAAEQLPRLRFLSFSHSAPLVRPGNLKWPFSARFTPLPRTTYIALTYAGIAPLAAQYGVPEGRCRVVYNSLDLLADMHPAVKTLAEHVDLFSPAALLIYPARLSPAKKFEKVAAFAGALKCATEEPVQVVFCDFPSDGTVASAYREMVLDTGEKAGLAPGEMVFTSSLGFSEGFPRDAVLDLFTLSNLFVMPSYSELLPLAVLEAASRGNLLVLNEAVPSLEEIGKRMHAVFLRWDALQNGYETVEEYQPSEQAYYENHAADIATALREDPVLRAKSEVRRRFSPAWVWHNQLGPLLDLD